MRLDTVKLANVLGAQLLGFFNTTWGSPEAAACELLGDPSFAVRSGTELNDAEASRMIRVFIESFDRIAKVAGWTGTTLLACAIAVQSWIEHLGDEEEEHLALLGVRRLLDATGNTAGGDSLSVVSLCVSVEARLQELGVAERL